MYFFETAFAILFDLSLVALISYRREDSPADFFPLTSQTLNVSFDSVAK